MADSQLTEGLLEIVGCRGKPCGFETQLRHLLPCELNLSEPQFSYLENESSNPTFKWELQWSQDTYEVLRIRSNS